MSSMQTPLHKVQGMGSAHSGTGHFWRQRVSAVLLVPLGIWFTFAALGLAGVSEASVVAFFARPWNAILMAAFVVTLLYHLNLGLQVIMDDYIHAPGAKILLRLLVLGLVLAVGAFSLFAIIRIASI
jgi:succinate dehydrogenase / fumarate reductase, membrane anchor subunit